MQLKFLKIHLLSNKIQMIYSVTSKKMQRLGIRKV